MTLINFDKLFYKNEKDLRLLKFPRHFSILLYAINQYLYKMSKSKGKILTIDTLIEQGFNPLSYRLMCLILL